MYLACSVYTDFINQPTGGSERLYLLLEVKHSLGILLQLIDRPQDKRRKTRLYVLITLEMDKKNAIEAVSAMSTIPNTPESQSEIRAVISSRDLRYCGFL
jgi:hypothetical protein